MSVTLRSRENSDGTTTLYLDIYNDGERKYEFLNNLKLCKAANPADRLTNKENKDAAKKIAVQRAQHGKSGECDHLYPVEVDVSS